MSNASKFMFVLKKLDGVLDGVCAGVSGCDHGFDMEEGVFGGAFPLDKADDGVLPDQLKVGKANGLDGVGRRNEGTRDPALDVVE